MTDAMGVSALAVMQHARANRYYRKAIETVGGAGYSPACTIREAALKMRNTLPPVPDTAPPADADSLQEWLGKAVAKDTAERERTAKLEALSNLIGHCEQQIQGVVFYLDEINELLHEDLMTLMQSVATAVTELRGATTPQQVIDRGVGDAWKKLAPPTVLLISLEYCSAVLSSPACSAVRYRVKLLR